MSITNLLIIFYSTYRTNQAIATEAAKAAEEAGVSVRLRRIAETAPVEVVKNQDGWKAQVEKAAAVELVSEEDLECSDALFLSSSTNPFSGNEVVLHGQLAALFNVALSDKKQAHPVTDEPCFIGSMKVVAGAGFEPAAFRL